jgi:hypothetical protein
MASLGLSGIAPMVPQQVSSDPPPPKRSPVPVDTPEPRKTSPQPARTSLQTTKPSPQPASTPAKKTSGSGEMSAEEFMRRAKALEGR